MDALVELLRGKRVCVLTGAGISTESGIPDYRGPTAPPRRRPPIQHRDFLEQPHTRADADATVKLEARAGELLPLLIEQLARAG